MCNKLGFCFFLLFLNTFTQAQQFKVSYSSEAFNGIFSGRVILYLSKDSKTPKELGIGLPTLSCYSIVADQIRPNTSVLFDDKAISYPARLSDIERGEYYVQAVWDRNTGGRNIGSSTDNMYSESIKINLTKNITETFNLVCDKVIPPASFKETEFIKELRAPSPMLTAFYKRAVTVDAAILLPKEYYQEPNRKFPVHFHHFRIWR